MRFEWNPEKNERLKDERNISFERIVIAIESDCVVDIIEHHARGNQYLILLDIDSYIWVVPTVINNDAFFLKTAFPSRKYTKIYLPEARL